MSRPSKQPQSIDLAQLQTLVGTKVSLKVSVREIKVRNVVYVLPAYELVDTKFKNLIKDLDCKIFLPDTRLSSDVTEKIGIYIDPDGTIIKCKHL